MRLCEYGCGREAKFLLKFKHSPKWCCEDHFRKCPSIVEKTMKKNKNPKYVKNSKKVCECGNIAQYYFSTTGRWCCSPYTQSCPAVREKFAKAKRGTTRPKEFGERHSIIMKGRYIKPDAQLFENIEGKLCSYGCGQLAKFIFKNGILCCVENYRSCPGHISNKKMPKGRKPKAKSFENIDNKLCDFGCGELAKFIFRNGTVCCSEYAFSCMSKRPMTKATKKKLSKINKKPLSYWIEQYPFFAQVEEMREDPITGDIQVHCKNHNCPNSKENNGWFVPTYTQLYERMRALERPGNSNGEDHFYCSQYCKDNCRLYRKTSAQLIKEDQIAAGHIKEPTYTSIEYSIWREEVFKRQKEELGYNECEYCGNRNLKELSVHHEKPQKTHPLLALDPDNGIIACGATSVNKCHYKYGHPKDTECSTGYLAKVICM